MSDTTEPGKSERETIGIDLLELLAKNQIPILEFCQKFINLTVSSRYEGVDILEDDLYNTIFDLCVRVEDGLSDSKQAELQLRKVAIDACDNSMHV